MCRSRPQSLNVRRKKKKRPVLKESSDSPKITPNKHPCEEGGSINRLTFAKGNETLFSFLSFVICLISFKGTPRILVLPFLQKLNKQIIEFFSSLERGSINRLTFVKGNENPLLLSLLCHLPYLFQRNLSNFAPLLFTESKQTNNRILLFFGKGEKKRDLLKKRNKKRSLLTRRRLFPTNTPAREEIENCELDLFGKYELAAKEDTTNPLGKTTSSALYYAKPPESFYCPRGLVFAQPHRFFFNFPISSTLSADLSSLSAFATGDFYKLLFQRTQGSVHPPVFTPRVSLSRGFWPQK
ncbi:hypothetical protein CDAR_82481 [Caerostris darwini]|uniref:Uncharacterized protein n=1 Tax=Caerostris darwini TaxID=1538125 RepID=A0AAV4PWT3_9ARAC|nr:hypothetical protein CDAR_82481 [Caerostris darwini]